MADSTISNLTAGTEPLAGTDKVVIVQGGATKVTDIKAVNAVGTEIDGFSRIKADSTETVFNEDGQAVDTRFESANNTNALKVDGTTGDVEIGENLILNGGGIAQVHSSQGGSVSSVGGGQYKTSTGTHTGAIEITLPLFSGNDMISFIVDVYSHAGNRIFSLLIGGYVSSTISSSWSNQNAVISTTDTGNDFAVRFGNNGVNKIVWIGELDSAWNFPQIAIRDLQVGFSANVSEWINGWSVSFQSSAFGTVDVTNTDNLPAAREDITKFTGTASASSTLTIVNGLITAIS